MHECEPVLGKGMVAQVKTYRVEAAREGRYWHVRVPGVERVTQAQNLREIEPMARDLIAIMTGAATDSFAVDIRVQLPADVRRDLDHAAALREQAAREQHAAAVMARTRPRCQHDQGVPLRDIGKLLGVSYQRAHQLEAA